MPACKQSGRGNIRVRVRMRSVNIPAGAAAVCQIRTSSGTSTLSLPAAAAAQTFAWYESGDQAYSTAGTHEYVSVALQANVQACGNVHLAGVEVWYAPAATLAAGVIAGTFRASDTVAWQADEALTPKRARDLHAAFEHLHTALLWPVGGFADDLQLNKGVWQSNLAASWVRVLGPVRIPTMGGGVVDSVGISALATGPAAADRVRAYTSNNPSDVTGDPPMIDSHTWTPVKTAFVGTEWRTAANWEDFALDIRPSASTYLFVDLKGNGAVRSYLHSLSLWAASR